MSAPLDEQYLTWLYSQVGSVKLKNPGKTYWSLLRQLYTKEFVWLIPNDDNRLEDGLDIRREFVVEHELGDPFALEWYTLGCSMLEMLLGLARRLAFETDSQPRVWFWHLIETLDILCNDKDYSETAAAYIDGALNKVIWRQYNPDGSGGLFPLRNPQRDQRRVEIWYQLNAYLLEL